MRRLTIIVLAGLLLAGCGKSKPTYELVIGGKTFTLTVHEDSKRIQDDLVAHVKPLWDALKSGTSEPFRSTSAGPWTVKSPSYGFFWNRAGKSGLEQLRERGEPFERISGTNLRWEIIESHLRQQVFSLQDIRWLIQNKWAAQTDPPDMK